MLPLVSVIMPAYNAEKYIEAAIYSILNQTYTNLELVIVEDCSTDGTLDVIRKCRDSRILLVQNQENKGIAYSTNRAMTLARGKYIALMDDDDMAAEDRLDLQIKYLEEHAEIDILGGRSIDIDSQGKILRRGGIPRYNPKYIKAVLLFKCLDFRNGTAMIRKSFVEKNNLQYQENCYGMQDYKFYIDSSKVGNISSIDNVLLYYREHEGNETKRRVREYKEQRKEKYAEFQRESLRVSGYKLDESKLAVINKLMAEYDGRCNNREDLQQLYEAFCEILRQARELHVDYYGELESYCKTILASNIKKLICFTNTEQSVLHSDTE